MKKILLRRFFSFFINLSLFVFMVLSFSEQMFLLDSSNSTYYVLGFILYLFLFDGFLRYKFDGFTLGSFIMRLKLVSFENKNISFINSYYRVLLSYLNVFSLFTSNVSILSNKEKLSFIDLITKSHYITFLDDDIIKLESNFKIIKSLIMFVLLNVIIGFLFYKSFDSYMVNYKKDFQANFYQKIDESLLSMSLSNVEANKNVKKCLWESDEHILGLPKYAFDLYILNEKNNSSYNKALSESFSYCLEANYPKEFLISE